MKTSFYHNINIYTEVYSKDADRLAYSKDPDQSVLGLLFLIRAADTNTLDDYGKCQWPDAPVCFRTIEFMAK